ncbi:putative poly(glycerol-phosphate) alpha-glucosyltransferase [Arthrobacter sp. SO3]|nr:putative poly(glycerol-phosphate) alpha-glucosyltransferase [Arthrobacter sp. SO3]
MAPAPTQPKPPESPLKNPDVLEFTARSAKNFPAGYHCAITWGIPTEYGGMTNALLHRSRSFIREAGVPVDVLTFAWSDKYPDIRRDLEAAAELVPGLRLRNLWEELAELSPAQLNAPKPGNVVEGGFAPIGQDETSSDEVSGGVLRRRLRYAADQKTVLQVDYFRPDGSLVVSDRRDVTVRGAEGGRLVSLCGRDGHPVASWTQIWPLYLFWLDCVVEGRESFMIVDSKSTANFMTRYRRDNVATMHLVHNSHMASGAIPPYGELSPTRRYVFERLSSFDAVVLLTGRQKKDVDLVFNNPRNTCVIPNSRSLPEVSSPELGHDPRLGVILGSLTNRKRLDHAISAVDLARQPGNAEFNLRIYGQGPEEASLRKLIAARDLDKYVELAGYSSSARQEFAGASFTLLTSTLEGQGLVLIEAMSVGCIPIAYDVPYGPSDIIEHGVNGFLVEAGDISALAERIRQVGLMDEAALQTMRRAAFARAHEFNDEIVVQKWGTAMRQAIDRKLSAAVYTPSSKGSI